MVTAMLLAHLVGDFILQTDRIAQWKSKAARGVLAHGLVVTLVTLVAAAATDITWLNWALFISGTHVIIDLGQFYLMQSGIIPTAGSKALGRFLIDQLLHFAVIGLALVSSGMIHIPTTMPAMMTSLQSGWIVVLGYGFITMPAWILIEFTVYGLVNGSAPNFSEATNKYVGILERLLITTFVWWGSFVLIPLVALPRVYFERAKVGDSGRSTLYVAELLTSVLLAVVVGLALRFFYPITGN